MISTNTLAGFIISIIIFLTFTLSNIVLAWYYTIFREEHDFNWCKDLCKYLTIMFILSLFNGFIAPFIIDAVDDT